MLDPWIIEEIRRREEDDRRRQEESCRIELPLEMPLWESEAPRRSDNDEETVERGVVVIDM